MPTETLIDQISGYLQSKYPRSDGLWNKSLYGNSLCWPEPERERPWTRCPRVDWRWDLVRTAQPLIQDGLFAVPEGPGLGIELDEEVVRAHLKPGSGLFEE